MDEQKTGLGCPDSGSSQQGPTCSAETEKEVYRLLLNGSPRLAFARALCIPFQPTISSVNATFNATGTTPVLNQAADQQFSQDTDITAVEWIVVNGSTTANSNTFQPQSDYFYSQQSGIQATLQLGKAPFYGVAPQYTPLPTLVKSINRVIKHHGWVLGLTQQITMSFNPLVAIPATPYYVTVTFAGRIPTTDKFNEGNMTKAEAIDGLKALGFCIPNGYGAYGCR